VTLRQLAMLLVLAALWGASFLFMRVAVPAFGPVALADVRVAIAGAALLVYALAIGARPALRARWRDYLLLGSINAALPFALLSAAELEIEASLAAVLNAMAPLCGAIVAAIWLGERVTAGAKVGLVLGVAGVTLVVGLSPFTLDLAFIGVNGIDPVVGPTSHDEREAAVNALMATRATHAVIVADSSKIDKRAFAAIGPRRLFATVITDSGATAAQRQRLADHGFDVIVAS